MKLFNKSIFLFITALMFFSPELFAQYANYWDSIPEEISKTNAFKRFEWFYRPRSNSEGRIPVEKYREQFTIEIEKLKSDSKSKFSKIMGTSDLWTNLGPSAVDMSTSSVGSHWGNVSGRARGLDVNPSDKNKVFIGAAAGGIWKTNNGGTNWVDKSGDFSLLTFGAIAIDPNDTATVFAGTGEARYSYNQQTYEGDGLYKSTNGGDSWTKITSGFGSLTHFADIEVSPHNSNIILAAVAMGNFNYSFTQGDPGNKGVWRSSDGGSTWTNVISYDAGYDVAFHPTATDTAYAVIGNNHSSSGLYVSGDAGATWSTLGTGLPDPDSTDRMHISISQSNPKTMYALVYDRTGTFDGMNTAAFKSTNAGFTWTQLEVGSNIAGTYNGTTISDQGSYDLCLDVSPTDPNKVFFGNVEMSSTTDGTNISFVRVGGSYAWDCPIHVDIHNIKFAPNDANYVYAVCDGGIFRSTDGGSTWSSRNNGINTLQFYNVASDPTNASKLYGGAQDNGNFRTTDKGVTDWSFVTTGDGMTCLVDYASSSGDTVLMSTQYGRIYLSTNGGSSFSTVLSSASLTTAWTVPMWQDPGDPDIIWAAHSLKMKKSTDKGATWSDYTSTSLPDIINTAAQSPVNTSNMMCALGSFDTTPPIYVSDDGGLSFDPVTTAYNTGATSGDAAVLRIVSDPNDGDTFYLCRGAYTSSGQVMKTDDLGVTFNEVFASLPDVPVNDLFFDPANTNHIYAANDLGVYWSTDGGTSWSKLSNGMPFLPVIDFDFYDDGSNRYLRAATHGRGVYELNIDSPLPVELANFKAELSGESVLVTWETTTEVNNYGFDVERSADNNSFVKIHFEEGNGTSNVPHSYSYTDSDLPETNEVWYRLKQIDNDGQSDYSKIVKVDISTITGVEDDSKKLTFSLAQNYPNPFNPATRIAYSVPTKSNVNITVVNVLGQVVSRLVSAVKPAGKYEAIWNAEEFGSGVYIYQIQAVPVNGGQPFSATRKMIFAK